MSEDKTVYTVTVEQGPDGAYFTLPADVSFGPDVEYLMWDDLGNGAFNLRPATQEEINDPSNLYEDP